MNGRVCASVTPSPPTINGETREAFRGPVVRPDVRQFRVRRYISVLSGWISLKLGATYSSREWALLRMFSRSEVKGQGHRKAEYAFFRPRDTCRLLSMHWRHTERRWIVEAIGVARILSVVHFFLQKVFLVVVLNNTG